MDIKVAASAAVVLPEATLAVTAAPAVAAAAGAEKRSGATCHRSRGTKTITPRVKMDPAKKAKSIILNPHLWSLKRM